jgi:MinD-like ATPase involved in chromosome partitioning or flagellar assembly
VSSDNENEAADRARRLPENDFPTLNIPAAEWRSAQAGSAVSGATPSGSANPDTDADSDEPAVPQHLATTQIPIADRSRAGRPGPRDSAVPDIGPQPGPVLPPDFAQPPGRPYPGRPQPGFTPGYPPPGPGQFAGPNPQPQYPPQGGHPQYPPQPAWPGPQGQPGPHGQYQGQPGPAPSGYLVGGPAEPQSFTGYPGGPVPTPPTPPTIDEIDAARGVRRGPQKGWRRLLHKLTGGRVTPAESAEEIELKALTERVRHPVNGDYKIAVLSLKGGVGKTTTTVGLGATFAALRGDRVVAVDANPDFGTLAHRGPQQTRATVRDLLHDDSIERYSDVRAYTSQAPSRLELIASERDPAVSVAFSDADYRGVIATLQRFYNIILTDCGTGLMHSAMSAVLDEADAIVLVSSAAIDGARSASATLDWLEHHGYGPLVQRAVVVLSNSRPGQAGLDTTQLSAHFLARARAVQVLPFDAHLAEGAQVELDQLSKATQRALIELAAVVADDFGRPRPIKEQPDLAVPGDTPEPTSKPTSVPTSKPTSEPQPKRRAVIEPPAETGNAESEAGDTESDAPRHGTKD